MSKRRQDDIWDWILGILFVLGVLGWGAPTVMMLFFGMMAPCKDPRWERIEYVYPGYRFGCWLTAVPK